MTPQERDEAAVRAYMDRLDHTALVRIRDADQWVCMLFRTQRGACCLVGHGDGVAAMTDAQYHDWQDSRLRRPLVARASSSYERLCDRQGADRTIAAIQHYAEHLLGTRLRALLGEEVPA
jgi:hypothetical protein